MGTAAAPGDQVPPRGAAMLTISSCGHALSRARARPTPMRASSPSQAKARPARVWWRLTGRALKPVTCLAPTLAATAGCAGRQRLLPVQEWRWCWPPTVHRRDGADLLSGYEELPPSSTRTTRWMRTRRYPEDMPERRRWATAPAPNPTTSLPGWPATRPRRSAFARAADVPKRS